MKLTSTSFADGGVIPAEYAFCAPDPRTQAAPLPAPSAAYDWDKVKQHWAFRPIQAAVPPAVTSPEWNRSPIDAFIKAVGCKCKFCARKRAKLRALKRKRKRRARRAG